MRTPCTWLVVSSAGDEPAIAGPGPDGRETWAVASDGVLVEVVTDD